MNTTTNIQDVFRHLREQFIIVGLTGAVGSGCTTSADFLTQQLTDEDINATLYCIGQKDEFDTEYRRIQRVKQYYKNRGWEQFINIRVSDILLLVLIASIKKNSFETPIKKIIKDYSGDETLREILKDKQKIKVEKVYKKFYKISKKYKKLIRKYNKKKKIKIIINEISKLREKYIDRKKIIYTKIFQSIGENIRKNGSVFCDGESQKLYKMYKMKKDEFENLPVFLIPELIRRTIKIFRKENKDKKGFFVIDALRNIYEIEFFRNRYQSFYLFSIQASESIRENRILKDFGFTPEGFKQIKDFETKDSDIASQAINSCIGKGDVFINNVDPSKINLKLQLLKYVALIRKPGLFTPTDDERYMQVAFTARYNSGCISRQVGAVVVGNDGYIRGFGWNDVPEEQVSCLYRTPSQLLENKNNLIFSQYERSEEFFEFVKEKISKFEIEKDHPFCFKDLRNKIEFQKKVEDIDKELNSICEKKKEKILTKLKMKNPTRERALHAEENAFLQITKSGGQTVVDGTLYSTDSPCQLCAKKAMQLKISRVVYIDAYPDISMQHTLQAGKEEKQPKVEMFQGAIGSAYFKLYIPIIGIKDEIKFILE